mgnify:FL=1|jgi:hypothetical protein
MKQKKRGNDLETETSFNITLFYFFSKTKVLKKSV